MRCGIDERIPRGYEPLAPGTFVEQRDIPERRGIHYVDGVT
jgi:hypothetical protein